MTLTPFHLTLLLHTHTSPKTYDPWSRLANEYLEDLQEMGALTTDEPNLTKYKTTPLGEAWINAILNTPLPRIAFLDQNGKEIQ